MSKSTDKTGYEVAFLVASIVPSVMWAAFVLTKLWNWYAMPFFGTRQLTMVYAFGLASIVHFLAPTYTGKSDRTTWEIIAVAFTTPAFALAMGWVGTWWLP